jgi:ketosteroid isomerase-like protein
MTFEPIEHEPDDAGQRTNAAVTTTPDPQLVREIAREQILNHAKNLAQDDVTVFESVIEKDVCIPLSVGEQEALADDVLAEIGRAQVTVSWPGEQPTAEQDGDVRAVAALRDALATGGRGWGEADALIAHFADRIDAQIRRDADGSAS